MTHLLDANVLLALQVDDHVHHDAAHEWFADRDAVATCPITEGALVRLLLMHGRTASDARHALAGFRARAGCEFWYDDVSYLDVDLHGVVGHRQVTDAYLASLARTRGGALATFDRGLAALHPDVVELIET